MDEDKIVTGERLSKDSNDDEIPPENVEDDLVPTGYRMTWSERKIGEIIQDFEYKIMELEAKRSQMNAKSSAAKLTADIELLLSDRDFIQKNLDEFLMKLADQQREGTCRDNKETMTCKKNKYDFAGTSTSTESTQEQWKDMFNLKSDSSSEKEMGIQKSNDDKKLRDNAGFVERMHKRIEAAFNGFSSNDDEPSQDLDFGIHTNIEGLGDKLHKLLSSGAEELKESKVEDDVCKYLALEPDSTSKASS